MELKSNLSSYLTPYVINILNKSNIVTVIDFVKEHPFKLSTVTNLELETINKIKNDIFSQFQPYSGIDYKSKIKTGIDK